MWIKYKHISGPKLVAGSVYVYMHIYICNYTNNNKTQQTVTPLKRSMEI